MTRGAPPLTLRSAARTNCAAPRFNMCVCVCRCGDYTVCTSVLSYLVIVLIFCLSSSHVIAPAILLCRLLWCPEPFFSYSFLDIYYSLN